jgi:hypothetical protein
MPDVGDLLQTAAGKWIIHPPTACTNGHTLRPGAVLVGHLACLGHGGGPNIYIRPGIDASSAQTV